VFVDFVEAGLAAADVRKVVPSETIIEEAYVAFARGAMAKKILEAEFEHLMEETVATPADLIERVERHLAEHSEETWDEAIRQIATEDAKEP
jgi:hypothetical protein